MLSVILMILKIMGIVLLSLLGLVLFLLLLVLLVPVRYRGKAEKAEAITADVHVTWLLYLVHVIVSYGEDGLSKKIKIFGFALKDRNGDTGKFRTAVRMRPVAVIRIKKQTQVSQILIRPI